MRTSKRIVALCLVAALAAPALPAAADGSYRAAAVDAGRWLRASAARTAEGTVWPADPRDAKSANNSLYSGNPGVVLFFLQAARATGDRSYLKDARAGADALLNAIAKDTEQSAGLYTGIAGIGFALIETYKATKEEKYRGGALAVADRLRERAQERGAGVEWSDVTDIISGSAGAGLFLLYAARELKQPTWRDVAARAGKRLIELARPENGGLKWAMDPKFPRLMPNFSHGTAGVAYFLATLYQETRRKEFLDAALAGARYLLSIARTEGEVCLIFHNEPDGKELHYLSWCHGPAGTARLFYRLYQVTGAAQWMDWVRKSARAILASGVPEKQTPGFWNNVGQCCGTAGAAEFLLSLHRITGDAEYLAFARRATDQILSRATRESGGLRWVHAEHRVRPELLVAQTGYMQGAAGIGMWLLRLDAFDRGRRGGITFPDSPW